MPGLHAQAGSHLIAVVLVELAVQGIIVAADAAAHDRGMGREDRADRRAVLLEVEQARAGLPLVELGDDLVGSVEVVLVETLDRAAGGITEEGRFLVVPVSAERIDAEGLPQLAQDPVLAVDEALVVDQDGDRPSGNVPAPDADAQTFRSRLRLPARIQGGILGEIGILLHIHPYIGADQDVMPLEL